jgi:hypothetical protein
MLKSKPSAFTPRSAIPVLLKKASTELCQSVTPKHIAPMGLIALLGLASVSWLTTSIVAPQVAQAYTARVNVGLTRETGESFRSFIRRAEAVARAAAQRSFDRDILVTEVAVTVVGQNNGAIAPLLSLEVSRQSWRRSPDPQRWITYFPNTDTLLGFDRTQDEPEVQPGGIPQPTPMSAPGAAPTPQAPGEPRVIELPGGTRQILPGSPPAAPTPQPGAPAQQTPSTPNVIELPGGNRQILPGTPPTNSAPTNPAPTNPAPLPAPPTR